MKDFLKKLTPFHWFIVKAVGLYLIWIFVISPFLVIEDGKGLENYLTVSTAKTASWLINLLPYESSIEELNGKGGAYLLINQVKTVYIAHSCNALVIIALYIGVIIAYPGPSKIKILFITIGSLIVYAMNVIRVAALGFNHVYHQASLDFNHKYTFTFMVYSVVFILWMIWANKYSSVKFELQNNQE